MSSRRISATISERKTEAWAMAMGVRVPLPHPGERPSLAHRGMLADVTSAPTPRRPSRLGPFGLGGFIAGLFGRAAPVRGVGTEVVAVLPSREGRPEYGVAAAEKKEPGLAA
jgi:hypothetical protein